MNQESLFYIFGMCVVVSPAALLAILGLASLVGHPLGERSIKRLTESAGVIGLLASLAVLGMMLAFGSRHVPIEIGNWVVIPDQEFQFNLKFVFDRLSVPFVILTYRAVRCDRCLHQSISAS